MCHERSLPSCYFPYVCLSVFRMGFRCGTEPAWLSWVPLEQQLNIYHRYLRSQSVSLFHSSFYSWFSICLHEGVALQKTHSQIPFTTLCLAPCASPSTGRVGCMEGEWRGRRLATLGCTTLWDIHVGTLSGVYTTMERSHFNFNWAFCTAPTKRPNSYWATVTYLFYRGSHLPLWF